MVRLLIEEGTIVDSTTGYRSTALYEAARRGHKEVVSLLIEGGAQVNHESGDTPLSLAAAKGYVDVAKLLVHRGANIDFVNFAGLTPLGKAVETADRKLVKLLIEMGASLGEVEDAKSPLNLAVQASHLQVAALLLEKGVGVEGWSWYGETPLMVGTNAEREDFVELFFEERCNH